MTQTTITAGDATTGLAYSGGNDGTLAIQTGPNGAKVNAVSYAADGTPTFLKSGLVLGTAQPTTSGTSIDFTGIPSWVKRITVMLNGVSLSASSAILIQMGAGSIDTSGYVGQIIYVNAGAAGNAAFSSGVQLYGTGSNAAILNSGAISFTSMGSNIWVFQGGISSETTSSNNFVSGRKTLSGTLDRIRLTTVNGTDIFDAGSVNILYEG